VWLSQDSVMLVTSDDGLSSSVVLLHIVMHGWGGSHPWCRLSRPW